MPIIILQFLTLISHFKTTGTPTDLVSILKYPRGAQNEQAYYKDVQTEWDGNEIIGIRYEFMEGKGRLWCFVFHWNRSYPSPQF